MGFLSRKAAPVANDVSSSTPPELETGLKPSAIYTETLSPQSTLPKLQADRTGDGDTALALFADPSELHAAISPEEERKLQRKIDFMILPYLAVCYAFFYIDKTTLSYAAIFGIRDDLHLVGTQYSWLSSIFYFGFLVC